MPHPLIVQWRLCNLNAPPHLFPEDPVPGNSVTTQAAFDALPTNLQPTALHLGLTPTPYGGNLEMAKIFLLSANPGYSPHDYLELQDADLRLALRRALCQTNVIDEFPFLSLNPQFAAHPGYRYWQGKLMPIAEWIIDNQISKLVNIEDAFKFLSKVIAVLEWFPYHSKEFPNLNVFPSSELIKSYVHDILVPKARSDNCVIIALRRAAAWELPNEENIIQYAGENARYAQSATLRIDLPAGKKIAAFIGEHF